LKNIKLYQNKIIFEYTFSYPIIIEKSGVTESTIEILKHKVIEMLNLLKGLEFASKCLVFVR